MVEIKGIGVISTADLVHAGIKRNTIQIHYHKDEKPYTITLGSATAASRAYTKIKEALKEREEVRKSE